MTYKQLARIGAQQELARLMKAAQVLLRMFPGIGDEADDAPKKHRVGVRRKGWTPARRKAQSERIKAAYALKRKGA